MDTVLELRCAPIPLVRIALIGLGQRGMKTLERYAFIDGAEIRCVADVDPARLETANQTPPLDDRKPTNSSERTPGAKPANATTSTSCTSAPIGVHTARWQWKPCVAENM